MQIHVQQGNLQTVSAEAIIVNLFKGVTRPGGATGAIDSALSGAISERIAGGDFSGKLGQVLTLYPRTAIPAERVIVVGLGPADKFGLEAVREASGAAIKQAQKLGATRVATIVHGGGIGGLAVEAAAQATVEGSVLAVYRYSRPGKHQEIVTEIESLTVVEFDAAKLPAIQAGADAGRIIAEGVNLVRTMVNSPSNIMPPVAIAETAERMAAEANLSCTVLEEDDMRREGMNALLAVTQGANQPAKFAIMEHKPANALNTDGPIVLVGKGVAFDTGGYSIKTRTGMPGMKGDMTGAAVVIGAMRTVGKLNLPLHVIGLVPSAENVISPDAYKPNDVFVAKNGVSIEIISTDAEGRMLLADALCYADTLNPSMVVDVATLTGGKSQAFGSRIQAIFSNDDALNDALIAAGAETGESLWRMPLDPAFDKQIKSVTKAADIKNTGGAKGSAITAARFLSYFVGQWPWAHLDIAGSEFYIPGPNYTARSYIPQGATGVSMRLLVAWLRTMGQSQ